MIEAAIVLPVLVLFAFGIVEWGLVFKDSLTVSSATRTSARTAVALPRDPSYLAATIDSVSSALTALPRSAPQRLTVYKAAPAGDRPVDGDFTTCTSCARFRWDGVRWVQIHDGWRALDQNACGGEADTLGVWIQARHDFLTGFFGSSRTLEDSTVMRLEPIPATQQCR
jgi:hypothetical protein